jgi:hypothetical protein
MIPFNKQLLRLANHVLDLKKNLTIICDCPSQMCKAGRQCSTVHIAMQHFAPDFLHFVAWGLLPVSTAWHDAASINAHRP